MDTVIVERNDIKLEFKPTAIKRGAKKGNTYPSPDVTKETLPLIQSWFGEEKLIALYKAELNKKAQIWSDEATNDDTGVFDPDVFIDMAKNVSARGETMESLKEEMEEITGQITELAGDMSDPTSIGKMQELALELKSLRAAYEAKKRPRTKKGEEEESKVATAA